MAERVKFPCPKCGLTVSTEFTRIRKIVPCPKCRAQITVENGRPIRFTGGK